MNVAKRWVTQLTSVRKHASLPAEPMGGLALVRNKPGLLPVAAPIPELPLPDQLVLPLLDYAKHTMRAEVNVGDSVKPGDRLAHGVLATANGIICAIEPRAIIHPSYREAPCVVIDVDHSVDENLQTLSPLPSLDVERLQRACISGLGGAGFSTADKLMAGRNKPGSIHTLLINAVECEPLISCDEALIRSDASSVVSAIDAMLHLVGCGRCIVAIEDDKDDAVTELSRALSEFKVTTPDAMTVEFMPLSAIYPSGAEKVMVQRITGKTLGAHERAIDRGILCLNVATVLAAWRAQAGYPMLSRVVTAGGSGASHPANVRVRIGTPVAHVLQHTGNTRTSSNWCVRAGGPLSGYELPDTGVPVTATTNCITVDTKSRTPDATACIRCSQCSDVCPVNLVPQQLYWHASSDNLPGAVRFGLDSCIECGCCDVVCPSSIQLTSTFRYARTAWREQQQIANEADIARERYEQRQARLIIREQEAQRIREKKKSQLASADDAIAKALARSRARKKKQ